MSTYFLYNIIFVPYLHLCHHFYNGISILLQDKDKLILPLKSGVLVNLIL